MGPLVETDDDSEVRRFLACRTQEERRQLLADLFTEYRQRLRLMVQIRLDPLLQKRLDPSDVIQEAYLEASCRLEDYLRVQPMPIYLWIRRITAQKLVDLHRRHLRVQARNARREVSIQQASFPEASSSVVAVWLAEQTLSSGNEVVKQELASELQDALEKMDPVDREVLVLRHFERLSNAEVARVLGLDKSAASKRHTRALAKLKRILWRVKGTKEDQR